MCQKIGCILMASGVSRRFGKKNKLLAEVNGKTLFEWALDVTDITDKTDLTESSNHLEYEFHRLVLTRTKEVKHLCDERGIKCILHDLPYRNEAIRLGVEALKEMDAIIFVPCDQPLLRKESVRNVVQAYLERIVLNQIDIEQTDLNQTECGIETKEHGGKIVRLGYQNLLGSPIIFDHIYFQELLNLPEKKGGSFVAKAHEADVLVVNANDEWELFDIDLPEDMIKIENK